MLQKQEGRGGNSVSYVKLLKLKVFGHVYELSKQGFLRDNIQISVPFKGENGITVDRQGRRLILRTPFGLTVSYADAWSEVLLVDAYSGHVCGLCGNYDGNKKNDYVNRNNLQQKLSGNKYTQYYRWGSLWRHGKDNDRDIDGQLYYFFIF